MQNFNLAKELAEQSEKDWVFGAASEPGIVFIPLAERERWLPTGELQFDSLVDFTDCASRSPVNHLEALCTYHYNHAMKAENKKWLEENGYTQDGKVLFSDRFIAVLSGTTYSGNSLKAPLEAIRTKGLIPKRLLPKIDTMTWDEYYAPVSQQLIDLGQEFLKRFSINYEQVPRAQIGNILGTDMVGVAGYSWDTPLEGVYQAVPASDGFNHAFLVFNKPDFQIFDNYYDKDANGQDIMGKFTKTLAPNYIFFDYGYRVYLSAENFPKHLFLKNLAYGSKDPEVRSLQLALTSLGYPIPDSPTIYFGDETKSALASFQEDNNIVDNGTHFGPMTRYALNVRPSQGVLGDIIIRIRTFLGL